MVTKVIQPEDLNLDQFEVDESNKLKVKLPERLVSGLSVEGSKIVLAKTVNRKRSKSHNQAQV